MTALLPPNTTITLRDSERTVHIVVGKGHEWEDFQFSETIITLLGPIIDHDEAENGDRIVIRDLYSIPLARVVDVRTARARIRYPKG